MSPALVPVVAHVAGVPVGAADDPDGCSGLAHLVEHLVLGRARDPRAPWTVNGATSRRTTTYEVVTTSEHAEAARRALVELVARPLEPSAEEVEAELRVIEVEARSPGASPALLGHDRDRGALTAESVARFHREHYRGGVRLASSTAPEPGPQTERPVLPPSFLDVHVREDDGLTRVVLRGEPGDASHAAGLLLVGRALDPLLPRALTPPSGTSRRRVLTAPGGPQSVSWRLTVEPDVSALAVALVGGTDIDARHRWLRSALAAHEETGSVVARFVHPDPLLDARWRCFWDLTVVGGHAALSDSLAADASGLVADVTLALGRLAPEPGARAVSRV